LFRPSFREARVSDFEVVKPATEEQCRVAFEHWFTLGAPARGRVDRKAGGEYLLMTAQAAWSAWQAAWKARTQ
jgi:hypothetical protein